MYSAYFVILYYDQQMHNYLQIITLLHVKHLICKLYYQQLHLKYLCNLARY